jgi:hypothetical protein
MKYVHLWKFEEQTWKPLGVKMPLDVESPITQTWANSIKIGEVYAFSEGSNDPVKYNPVELSNEILNLISPSQGIRDQIEVSKKLFEGSSNFFIERTTEIIKPEKLAKRKFIPGEGTEIEKLLHGLEQGLSLEDSNFASQKDLVNYLGKLGYQIELKGGLYYLCKSD